MKSTEKDIRSEGIVYRSIQLGNSKKESINYIKVTLERSKNEREKKKKLLFQTFHTDKTRKRNAKNIW